MERREHARIAGVRCVLIPTQEEIVRSLRHSTVNMTSNVVTENSENTCVVCFKNVVIYSVGECDHPVCYECSTRMRVLCRQNECPICRQDMPKV